MEYRAVRTIQRFLILLLILAFIVQGSFFDAFAADTSDEEGAVAAETASVSFIPKDKRSTLDHITFPFLDTKEVAYDWTFPYSDKFFRRESDSFSVSLAQGSLGLALSAFRSTPDVVDPQYETYLSKAGFTDLFSFGFDEPTTEDSLSGIIGSKQIGDFTLIAAVTCGQGYGNEWAGNLKIGKGDRHEGFNDAALKLEDYIWQYIRDKDLTGKKKLWLSGISRAAAVGNITAADMIESGQFDDIYAYLFGVPRTTRTPVRYSGIYNICGQYDPVSAVPLQSWGYERYGTDLYTPSEEADTLYTLLASHADKVSRRLEKKKFRNNPEINFQLHLILEFMGEFFPTAEDYADRMQDELIAAWNNHDKEHLAAIIKAAMADVDTSNPRENASRDTFIDYISYIAAQHMRYEQRQVVTGSWDPSESLAANVALEHRPSTYVKWLFSHIDTQDMLMSPITSRRLTFDGDVVITVSKDGVPLTWIDAKGNVHIPKEAENYQGEVPPKLFMMKNGNERVVSLPADEEYYVELDAGKGGNLTYYDVTISPDRLMGRSGTMKLCIMQPGTYGLRVVPGEDLPEPDELSGRISVIGDVDFQYSPAIVMSDELESTRLTSLSLSSALVLISVVIGFLLALGLICLIIAVIHGFKIKRLGHKPYSNGFVIVPHIIVITVFAAMTQFLTYFLFSIGRARAECAVICVVFIFLLSLRGCIRSRRKSALIYTFAMLVLVPLTQLYYHSFPLDSFSITNMVLYFLVTALLTYGAVRTFPSCKSIEAAPAV